MMGWGQGCEDLGRLGTGHMWGSGMGMVGPLLGLLFLMGFLALLVIGGVFLARRTGKATRTAGAGGDSTVGGNGSALELLQDRLAEGEISIEEYRRIRDELKN